MDNAARDVMDEFKDVVLAFGESDEYRHAIHYALLPINNNNITQLSVS